MAMMDVGVSDKLVKSEDKQSAFKLFSNHIIFSAHSALNTSTVKENSICTHFLCPHVTSSFLNVRRCTSDERV